MSVTHMRKLLVHTHLTCSLLQFILGQSPVSAVSVERCREPPWEIPPMTKVMWKRPDRQRQIRPRGTPRQWEEEEKGRRKTVGSVSRSL